MIRSSAASAGAYWEPLLALLLEQRRAAGREPHSEPRLAAQPGYLGEWLLRPHHRPGPITVIRYTGIQVTLTPVTVIQPMDIPGTHRQAMGTRAILVVLVTPAPPPMDTKAIRSTPLRPAMSTRATQGTPLTRVRQVTDIEAVPLNRGSAWAFSCLAASDGTASRRRGREHGTWTALLLRKLGMRIGSCVTHPLQTISYCDGNSGKRQRTVSLFAVISFADSVKVQDFCGGEGFARC